MEYQFINIEGIQLAYLETKGISENIIFFIHGNSSSSLTWSKQLESPLFSHFRLIAFDLPAHGLSGTLNDYSLPGIATLMTKAILKLAANKPYLLVGFSIGTNVISEMLSLKIQPLGIVLISSCAISTIGDLQTVFFPHPDGAILFRDELDMAGLKKLAGESFFNLTADKLDRYIKDFIATKSPFRSRVIKNSIEGKLTDEIASLKRSGVPLQVFFGKNDKIVNPDHIDNTGLSLWKNKIFKLEKGGHFVHEDQPEAINQLLTDYATDQFKIGHS